MNQYNKSKGIHLSAKQAAGALGITRATLYAYTSRGQLRSEPVPGTPRERRYFREDVDRLLNRKEARRDPGKAAARGLHWGSPVLESGITLIHDGKLYYRGRDAMKLAESAAVEEVAALLWTGTPADGARLFAQDDVLSQKQLSQIRTMANERFAQMQISLAIAGEKDVTSFNLRPPAVQETGGRILRLLTAVTTQHSSRMPIHRALQAAWCPKRIDVADVIRTALILCADHELNVSAFAARCAASAGASPYDVVLAGMAALKGYKHGGASEAVLALSPEARDSKTARLAVASRMRRGERVPGFGHRLYPNGDPRAVVLMRLAENSSDRTSWLPFRHLRRAGSELLHEEPNLDFGLAAITRTYGLPDDAPLIMFALGRTIGWIAHAIEEYTADKLIRPRAQYTGPAPQS